MGGSCWFVRFLPLTHCDACDWTDCWLSLLTHCDACDWTDCWLSLLQYKIPDEQEGQDMEQVHPLIDYTPPHLINRLISDIGVLPPGAILDEMLSLYH